MKLLLDTHVFIWWDSNPTRLSSQALTCLQDPASELILSVVSVWEIVIKRQLGKLTLTRPLSTLIAEQQSNGLTLLDARLDHVLAVETLPTTHKDPFDRLLVAQAVVESCTLLTADPIFAQYPVQVIW